MPSAADRPPTPTRALPLWLRATLFVLLMPGTVAGWLPWRLARPDAAVAHVAPAARPVGAVLLVIGWGVLLWCVRDFFRRGRGTLAPQDPPVALVTSGLYALVRNPMYVGVLAAIGGWALWYGSARTLAYGACMALAFHLRVTRHEEPTLARTFGARYDAYRARVPRWIPRPRAGGPSPGGPEDR